MNIYDLGTRGDDLSAAAEDRYTRYEELTRKCEALHAAALRVGTWKMRDLWLRKETALLKLRKKLTIAEAGGK